MISVSKLDKVFGVRYALRGVDLQVNAGEMVALLGPNGAGKSTLLRSLATLSRPTRGKITLGEYELPEYASEARSLVGYVGHQTLLYDDLTAYENLLFYSRLYALPNSAERIRAASSRVGLERRLHEVTRTLSRGWQQRVALARALLHQPRIWLFDEPYTGLDANSSDTLESILSEARESKAAVLFSSHDFERALAVCDRAVIINNGRVVYDAPRNEWHDLAGFRQIYAEKIDSLPARGQ
ncbi:MAG TPA: heme ABC exporter ATP-binding protein CcmA [Anaerolineae bacterium]